MRDQTENEVIEQAKAAGPYGDVALGVECAWPQLVPLEQPAPGDASISIRFQL